MNEPTNPQLSLSVFFPCYNEEGNIERVVLNALRILPTLSQDFEIILVDDGSQDRTPHLGQALCRQSPCVKMVRHSCNIGYGAALTSGFQAATKEWVFFSDGDGQFDLAELPKLLEKRGQTQAVLGFRLNRRDPFHRSINTWLWSKLIRFLFGLEVRDLDCAFKLFRRADVQALELQSRGAFISVELLAKLKKRGVRFYEVGVHHYPRLSGRSTGASLSVIARAFFELLRLWKNLKTEPVKHKFDFDGGF